MQIILGLLWGLVLVVVHGLHSWGKFLFPAHFSKSVKDQVVLITGGGSGIGRLMCKRFGRLGAVVVTCDVNKAGNDQTVKEVQSAGGRAYGYVCDLGKREDIYAMAEKVKKDIGDVDILINNAGIVSGDEILKTPDTKIELTFKVNVLAHFWTIKAFMPAMIQKGRGHIVNIASLAGHSGVPKLVDYCSSKFAAVGLDDALINELAHMKRDYVKTTVICPFYINTGMFDGARSKIVPILKPDWTVDRIMDGVLTETEVVLLPWWTQYLLLLKTVLPVRANMYLSGIAGFSSSMNDFIGRNKK